MTQQFKKLEYRPGGMKAIANSGHRTFDNQVDIVSRGNVFSTVQASSFVRAWSETECNGFTSEPGALQAFDLKLFIEKLRMPSAVQRSVKNFAQTSDVILYCFFHHKGDQRIIHGWVITDAKTHVLLGRVVTGPTTKSDRVIDWCIQYITPLQEPCLK